MSESPTMRCEDALRLLASYLDRELRDDERTEVEHHLATCRSCYSRAEFERRLKRELGALRDADVPATLAARIHQLLDERAR